MSNKGGRPVKANKLSEYLEIRVGATEKQAFRDAAELAGVPLSVWMRERMRRAAVRELAEAARPVAFLPPSEMGSIHRVDTGADDG